MADIFLKGLDTLHRTMRHELFPGFELDLDDEIKPEENFHGDAEHEFFLPASSVPSKVLKGQDPVHSLVTRKQAWIENCKLLDRSAKKQFSKERQSLLRKKLKQNSNVLVVPQHEIKFLEISRRDPDPEFSTGRLDYNWYYTGGTLKSLHIGGEELLLSTQGKAGDQLRLTCMERDSSWKPVLPSADTTTPEKKKAILQVEGCATQNTGFVGVRLRDKCILYSIIQDDGCPPSLHVCGESLKSLKPFVGLDLCSEPKAQYCTVSTNQTVQVWDLATMRCSTTYEGKPRTRRHRNQIQFSPGSRELILSNSHSIRLLDQRSKDSRKLPFGKQLDLLPCEEISLVFPSRRSRHLLYVATTHKLMLMDKRSSPCKAVSTWAHQMSSPPLYSHTVLLPSSQEVVCVANQRPATVQLAVPSTHQLLKLNTIQDSLHQAQSRGECLDPFLNTRLDQSLVGITCLPSDREETGFSLLSLTAAGDVFHQCVQAGSTTRRGQGLRGTLPVPAKKLYVTKRCNMKTLYSGLRNKNLKLTTEDTPEAMEQQAWQRSKSSLFRSKDVLSSILLDMWDLDEWADEIVCEEEDLEAARKVSSWLESVRQRRQDDGSSSEHSFEMLQS